MNTAIGPVYSRPFPRFAEQRTLTPKANSQQLTAMPSILPALADRRARRAFDPCPVPDDVQEALWRAVQAAPSHGNAQPTRILVAQSPEVRQALIEALSEGNRAWAPAAPLLAAVAAIPTHDTVMSNRDGSERHLWPFHAGIATGNLLAQATALGLVAHPMAGFDEPSVRAAFGAPDEVRILAVVAIGYPGAVETLPEDLQRAEARPQDRLPLDHLVVHDRWDPGLHGASARDLRRRS
jgi:nitroreductase